VANRDFLFRVLGDASQGISELDKFAKKADDLTHVGQAGMIMGGLVAAGVGIAVAQWSDFDAAMSNVVATGDDARNSQDELRQAALDAGASTVFSATESANAIEELAKAGISADDTLSGGLLGSLNLAAAGGLGVADAAATMSTAMTQFEIAGSGATHVADLLAAGAGKAQGDVSDMSQALAQAGLVANATGLSIEETTGGLAAFASAGLLGSDAGTSFKSMLQRLTPQSAEAQRTMDSLGVSAYDAGGNFIGLANFAGNLQDSLRSLTPEQRQAAMATIFGSDAVRAATILYNQGAAGIEKWTEAVDDQGYAAEVARTRLDNLQGDMEELGGAIETALIKNGSGANDSLRALTSGAAGVVTWISELPAPIQQTGLYLAIATGAVGLFGGAALIGIPKVVALKAAVDGTNFSLGKMSLAAGGATIGLTAVIAVVAAVAAEQAEARARAEAYADTLEMGSQRITSATRDMVKENLAASRSFLWMDQGSAYDNAEALGISLDLVTDAASGQADALAQLQRELDASQQKHDELGLSAQAAMLFSDRLADAVKGESSSLAEAADKARQKEQVDGDVAAASGKAADASGTAAGAYLDESTKVAGLTEEIDKLLDQFSEANGVGQDAVTTNARWRESLAGIATDVQKQKDAFEKAHGSLSEFSLSLDENTVSGSANASMLAGVASDAQKAAEAQFELEKNTLGTKTATDNYAATLAAQRQAFIDSATEAGYNAEQVQLLADKVFALPTERQLKILAETAEATQKTLDFAALWDGIRNKTVSINAIPLIGGGQAVQSGGPLIDGYSTGGEVRGPGTGTSDSIAAWLSDEEFIVQAGVARKNKGLLQHLNNSGQLAGYRGPEMTALASAATAPLVPMIPLAGTGARGDDSGMTRSEQRQEIRSAVAEEIAEHPPGNSYTVVWPEGATAEQLLRTMDEDASMQLRVGK